MDTREKISFKNLLKQHCQSLIEGRIQSAIKGMDNAQEAANNEEKSSAGDKYETSRAMGHLERDLHARQLAENRKELASLNTIDTHILYERIGAGAYFETAAAAFFIAAGLGRQNMAEKWIYFLSPGAPLAKAVEGKSVGDLFLFMGKQTSITSVY